MMTPQDRVQDAREQGACAYRVGMKRHNPLPQVEAPCTNREMWLAWFRGYDEAAHAFVQAADAAFCRHNAGLSGGAPRAVRSDPLLGKEDRP